MTTDSETTGDAPTPPPGTMGREGVVPAEGVAVVIDDQQTAIEAIGNVPGPGEGVYGDPPNTGGTVNPETRGWSYDTGYFFALTRGLEPDTDLGAVGRRWVRPWTITFDVVTLPTAALAGLSGAPPATDDEDAHSEQSDASSADAEAAESEAKFDQDEGFSREPVDAPPSGD